jgi:CubicO group peptidase (beta-lactamase class C family)
MDRNRFEYAAAVAEEAVRSGSHACAVMAVANSRETLWTHVVSGEDRVDFDTIFLLASITKPITATAVMQMVEQGRLLLNQPVAVYMPEFGANGKQTVTTRHLLTHTSGMNEMKWINARISGSEEPTGTNFEEACRTFLNFPPGTRCEYCTLSFEVMAELIARLSGKPYAAYLRDHLFTPLGMKDTAFLPADMSRAAPVRDFGAPEQLEEFMRREIAGGGLWSTASDLIAFGQAFLRGGRYNGHHLLSPAAIEMMTRHHTAGLLLNGTNDPFPYAFGWGKPYYAGDVPCSERAYEHGGATGTRLWVDPEWDLIYVFLTNRWGQEHETPRRALNAVYGAL